jgi:hypothetical protein
MDMSVDNGDGRLLGFGACRAGANRSCAYSRRLHELASIHFASSQPLARSAPILAQKLQHYGDLRIADRAIISVWES